MTPFMLFIINTVEPVLSSTLLSFHPVLSGRFSKSRNVSPELLQFLPLLSGGHLCLGLNGLFLISSNCIERSLHAEPLK